jgi:hypothetical protein
VGVVKAAEDWLDCTGQKRQRKRSRSLWCLYNSRVCLAVFPNSSGYVMCKSWVGWFGCLVCLIGAPMLVGPSDQIKVVGATTLTGDPIPAERVALGEDDDYKPSLGLMPDGELLLTAFHQHQKPDKKVLEQSLLFRSRDGGKTWSKAEKLELLGREPYLTILRDGTIFITGHLLANDVRNRHGYTHGSVAAGRRRALP